MSTSPNSPKLIKGGLVLVDPDSAQETKTRRVLEYLAAGGGPR